MYYTPKKVLPFAFFNLPGLLKPGRNRFSDKSLRFKIGHNMSRNKNMNTIYIEMWRRFDFKMFGFISF